MQLSFIFRRVSTRLFVLQSMYSVTIGNTANGESMKRFVVVFILVAVIAAVLTYTMPRKFETVANSLGDGTASIYCRSTSLPSVDMGNGRIVECDASKLGEALTMCSEIDGISVSFCGTANDAERIAVRLVVAEVSRQDIDGLTVICGYSAKISGHVWLDGKQVNIQIAYNKGTVTVGSPLILGSY